MKAKASLKKGLLSPHPQNEKSARSPPMPSMGYASQDRASTATTASYTHNQPQQRKMGRDIIPSKRSVKTAHAKLKGEKMTKTKDQIRYAQLWTQIIEYENPQLTKEVTQ